MADDCESRNCDLGSCVYRADWHNKNLIVWEARYV